MNKRWLALLAAFSWLLLFPAAGLGSGFALYEAGARGSALAGAMVARADDLSAIFYNPAGLVQLPGFRVMGGASFIIPRTEVVTHFDGVDTRTLVEKQLATVPHFFASYQAAERVWLGLGVNSPFGLSLKYHDSWPGQFNILQANLQTLNVNPTVAVKITDYLSAGAGLDIMYFNIKLRRVLPIPLIGPQALHVAGNTWGVGANCGLQFKPRDWLALGLSYRSQIKEQVSGQAKFQPFTLLNANASGSIILPDQFFAGVMVRPLDKLSVEVGAYWTRWSLFHDFDLKFTNPLKTLSERKDWHDTWRGQVGLEYRALPWLDLRGGYAYENEPMPDSQVDYLVPTSDRRHNFAGGVGFRWRDLTLDLAYTLVYMPDRSVNTSLATGVLPSTFQGRLSHVMVCSLGYKF